MITLPLLLPGGSSQVGGRPSDLIQGGLSGAGSRADLGKEGIMPIFRDMSGQAVATQMTQDAQDTEGSQPGQQEVVGEGTEPDPLTPLHPTSTPISYRSWHGPCIAAEVWKCYDRRL